MHLSMMHQFFHAKLLKKELFRFLEKNCKIHTSGSRKIRNDDHREIVIPVPWGQISGKWWGREDVQPMFALHGVQDNAATFDRLAPLLKVEALLALDIPGHGRSSHIPKGFLYHFLDAICVMRFVINDYFKWGQPVELLGHSFGSALSFVYAALYPEEVSKYISIDCARHHTAVSPNTIISTLKNTIDKTLEYEDKTVPPEYTYEELVEVVLKGRKHQISRESCEILLTRGTTKLDNGKLYLSRDIRLKLKAVGRISLDNLLELAPKIKCDVLSIQAENGTVHNNFKGDVYKKTVEYMIKNSPKSRHVILAGNHHLHLDNPEPVANEINKFLAS